MQGLQSSKQEGSLRTPSTGRSVSSPQRPNPIAVRTPSSAGGASSSQPLPRNRPVTPSKPGGASTPQAANPPQGPRNLGNAETAGSPVRANRTPSGARRMISRRSPQPLRESPRAPKHSLESPTGQSAAKRLAPDLS
jgi:hypothetical protein